jgi:HK97 family phage portal protein
MSVVTSIQSLLFGTSSGRAIAGLDLTRNTPQAFGEAAEFNSLDDPRVASFFRTGRKTSTGVLVNEQNALRNSAIYRAVVLTSMSIGMLPCNLYQKVEESRQVKDEKTGETRTETSSSAKSMKDHPLYRILRKKPNKWQTPTEFMSFMVQRAMFDGTAYAVKKMRVNPRVKGGMAIDELIPINPKWVEPKMGPNWTLFFRYHDPAGPAIDIPMDQMFWFRSPISQDGVTGVKLLDVAAEAIGLAHTAERASGRVLSNGAIVGGVLEHPKALGNDAINRLRNQFEERQSGPENAGKWVVAEDGLKAVPFGHTLKDAQNQELRKFEIEEVSRFTGVPRPLLSLDETSWGSGIEQLGLFLITYCLLPWFTTIEEAIWRSLLTEAEQTDHYAKFNEGALLRGSLENQANFFAKALGSGGGRGWMTQNEVRDKFELNPKDGGDELPEPITKGSAQDGQDPKDPAASPGGAGGGKPPARD